MKCLFVLCALILTGCISSVPQVKKIVITKKIKYNYCLRAQATYNKKLESVELCTETKGSCNKALFLAKRYGSLANLKQVDTCVQRQLIY